MNKYCNRVLMKLIVVLLVIMAREAIATDTGSTVPPEPSGKCDDMLCDGLGTPPPDRILYVLDPEQGGVEACACGLNLNLVRCNPARVGAPDACLSGNPLLEIPQKIDILREGGVVITCYISGKKRICVKS